MLTDQAQFVNLHEVVEQPGRRHHPRHDLPGRPVEGRGVRDSHGQELSEHTASKPAVIHFLSGEADVTLGDQPLAVTAGAWVHMPAGLPHSIAAKTPTVILLLLLKYS